MAAAAAEEDTRGLLHVIVHSAQDLPAVDLHLMSRPSSDPYCILALGQKRFRTHTVNCSVNPEWEEIFSFQIGTFLPRSMLKMLGQLPLESMGVPPLEITIIDEEWIQSDDALGKCKLDLQVGPICEPNQWFTYARQLTEGRSRDKGQGIVKLSVCWEPASHIPAYLWKIMATVSYACAGVLLVLAAFCGWTGAESATATRQPGVAAALGLGSAVMLLSTIVQFIMAHTGFHTDIDKVASQFASHQGLMTLLAGGKMQPKPVVKVKTKVSTRGTELTVVPTMALEDMFFLPMVIVNWLLPMGGIALGFVALALQALQEGRIGLHSGPICSVLAVLSAGSGFACAIKAEVMPRVKMLERQDKIKNFGSSPTMGSSSMSPEEAMAVLQPRSKTGKLRQLFFGCLLGVAQPCRKQ